MTEKKPYGIDEWVSHPDVHISITKNPQEAHEDAKLRRFKDKCLFLAALVAVAIVFGICICFLTFRPESPHVGTTLNGTIGLAMGLIGYYVRGKTH